MKRDLWMLPGIMALIAVVAAGIRGDTESSNFFLLMSGLCLLLSRDDRPKP